MVEHKTRLILITVMLVVAVISAIIMTSLGQTEGTAFGAVIGLLSTLAPAFFDALGVQKHGGLLENTVRPARPDQDHDNSYERRK